jgi:hypothetical protein
MIKRKGGRGGKYFQFALLLLPRPPFLFPLARVCVVIPTELAEEESYLYTYGDKRKMLLIGYWKNECVTPALTNRYI